MRVARLIGRLAKPRVLIRGFDDDVADQLASLFPTSRRISNLPEVAQNEWDVLLTTKSVHEADPHLFVIGIGCDFNPGARAVYGRDTFGKCQLPNVPPDECPSVSWGGSVKERELVVPDGLPPAIRRLVERTLVPKVQEEADHPTLTINIPSYLSEWTEVFRAFLLTNRGRFLAGRFTRAGSDAECWCLPRSMEAFAPFWVEAALAEWSKLAPATFPSAAWVDLPQWRTPNENRLASRLDELRAKRIDLLARMQEAEEALEAELTKAKQTAEGHERALLTGTGEDLEAVVGTCLSELGFTVQRMDEVYPEGDRREDLQVTDPTKPGWTALAEVKGYMAGAKVTDLMKLGRFGKRYLQDHGRAADASWYIVNQFSGDDPDARSLVLASNEAELAAFAEDQGLAIDTRDLFQLWMAVREGRIQPDHVRNRLTASVGRFAAEALDTSVTEARAFGRQSRGGAAQ